MIPVTGFFAGVLGFGYMALSFLVVHHRRRLGVSIGDGSDKIIKMIYDAVAAAKAPEHPLEKSVDRFAPLGKAIRTHGNFGEYVPFSLLMLGLLEANKAVAHNTLVYLGLFLVASRVSHFIGLYGFKKAGPNVFRFFGALSSFGLLATLSYLLVSKLPLPALL